MDQTMLAGEVGVHVKTVSRWENDAMAPDTDALRRVARALNVDFTWLVTGERPSWAAVYDRGVPIESGTHPSDAPTREAIEDAAHRVLRTHRVRSWLADFRAELTHARATDQEIDRALQLLATPTVLTFYSRDQVRPLGEEDAIMALEAVARAIRAELKRRGRKFE